MGDFYGDCRGRLEGLAHRKLLNQIFMPKIDELTIQRIKDAARIEDVVGDFVELRKAGVNYTGLCPFHDDHHTGNFIVRPASISNGGNTYKCFVCGQKGSVVQFLMEAEKMSFPDAIRYLGRKYSIPVDDVPVNWTPPPPRPVPPPLPRLTFKRQTVRESMKGVEQTLFVGWLWSLPWNDEQRARLANVLRLYCVASCPHGPEWVAFWQITHDGTPLTAKYMKYQSDGHRVKDRDAQGNRVFSTDWEHAWRARMKQYDIEKYDTRGRALFGEHLLNRYPEAVVNVVESEKTALVMATYYGDFDKQLWLACGGLKFLQLDMLQPLIDQGRTVWLWPDKDGRDEWQEVADKLGYDRISIYTDFFDSCWREEDGPKADVADIAIRMMRTGDKPRQTEKGQRVADHNAQAGLRIGATTAQTSGTIEWNTDAPFLDPEEEDPRVREWRQKLRDAHRPKWPSTTIPGVKSVGEILTEHPLLKKLIK